MVSKPAWQPPAVQRYLLVVLAVLAVAGCDSRRTKCERLARAWTKQTGEAAPAGADGSEASSSSAIYPAFMFDDIVQRCVDKAFDDEVIACGVRSADDATAVNACLDAFEKRARAPRRRR